MKETKSRWRALALWCFFPTACIIHAFPAHELRKHRALQAMDSDEACTGTSSTTTGALCRLKVLLATFVLSEDFEHLPWNAQQQMTTILLTNSDGSCTTYNSSLNPYPYPYSHPYPYLSSASTDGFQRGSQVNEPNGAKQPNESEIASYTLVVDCSHAKLTQIPRVQDMLGASANPTDFARIRVLNLSHNSISLVKGGIDDSFKDMTGLRHLVLSNNELKAIDAHAFRGLNELVALELSNNQIDTIHDAGLHGLSKVQSLALAQNRLSSLSTLSFAELTGLLHLDLHGNQFKTIGEVPLSGMTRLRSLFLDGNQIHQVKVSDFSEKNSMNLLSLRQNQMKTIQPAAFKFLKHLNVLDLSKNNLAALSHDAFSGLIRLEALSLQENRIQTIDPGVFHDIQSISSLRFDNNRLETLHEDLFAQTPYISSINFSRNSLVSVGINTFQPLLSLVELDLSFNQINVAPKLFFDSLKSLRNLNLENNPMNPLDREIFQGRSLQDVSSGAKTFDANLKVACPPGRARDDRNVCVDCPPGKFSAKGELCEPCQKQEYQDLSGQSKCKKCPSYMTVGDLKNDCVSKSTCGGPCLVSLILGAAIPFFVSLFALVVFIVDFKKKEATMNASSQEALPDVEQQEGKGYNTKDDGGLLRLGRILKSNKHLQRNYIPYEKVTEQKLIASSPSGEVWSGFYGGHQVLIKRLLSHRLNEKELKEFAEEVQLMASLRHSNIASFMGVTWTSVYNIGAVTEFLDRDLFSVLHDKSVHLTWQEHKLRMALDSAMGLAYLHAQKKPIVHGNLTSSNILVTDLFHCKLSDFGMSRKNDKDKSTKAAVVDTNLWLAPEVIRGERITEKSDCFSWGIVLTELETRRVPYDGLVGLKENKSDEALLRHIERGVRPELSPACLPSLAELVQRCTLNNAEERPRAQQIVDYLRDIVAQEVQKNLVTSKPIVHQEGLEVSSGANSHDNSSASSQSAASDYAVDRVYSKGDLSILNLKKIHGDVDQLSENDRKSKNDPQNRLSKLLWE